MSAASGSFTKPSRTMTIHNDILIAMLLPLDVNVRGIRHGPGSTFDGYE
jgi:hypothetical protein